MGAKLSCGINPESQKKAAIKAARQKQIQSLKNGLEKRRAHIERFQEQAKYGNTLADRERARRRLAAEQRLANTENLALVEAEIKALAD